MSRISVITLLIVVAVGMLVVRFLPASAWYRGSGNDALPARPAAPRANDLAAERRHFATHLIRHGRAPGPQEVFDPPTDANEVRYPSDDLQLRAWVSKDPGDGKRHPAIVYLHGNFTFDPGHWDSTRPYREAGFVEMTPMTRGENGNPGDFELFYGEVDDVIAAGEYLASLPYVDPERVYLAGHSVGGTLAILASEMPSRYAAIAAFSGAPNMGTFLSDEPPELVVFERTDPREMRLRSASNFVRDIRCPLFIFDGDREEWVIPQSKAFVAAAQSVGKDCQMFLVPGGHVDSKPIAIRKSIPLLLGSGTSTGPDRSQTYAQP